MWYGTEEEVLLMNEILGWMLLAACLPFICFALLMAIEYIFWDI